MQSLSLRLGILLSVLTMCSQAFSQTYTPEQLRINLDELLADFQHAYPYLEEKGVSLTCIDEKYGAVLPNIQDQASAILLFEYILDEFYDSHVILNTNISWSYRLYAPIYVQPTEEGTLITHVWQSQMEAIPAELIGAKVLRMNGQPIESLIDSFPTRCHDKQNAGVREWLANKVIAGRYAESRLLGLELASGEEITYDLDKQLIREDTGYLQVRKEEGMGIIRVNNSLGEAGLIQAFDEALDTLMDTKGLIIDLRNTIGGGDSYIARGIMGRFISESAPYQQHAYMEDYGNHPPIPRKWVEYVDPRGKTYEAPVIILVGKWTGSMGEGLAIGFEGMQRGTVMGTEMQRLAGSIEYFPFDQQFFGYRISTQKLSHVNGTPREKYVPTYLLRHTTSQRDEFLEKALEKVREEVGAIKK